MARDTDRKKISEAVRLSPGWLLHTTGANWVELVKLDREGRPLEWLNIDYGRSGQVIHAFHCYPGIRNGILTRKRERVLAIIEGR